MIYLDNSATTQPFEEVILAMDACMRSQYFNVSAAYAPALEAEKKVRQVRAALARELGCSEKGIVFTAGGTESDNMAILGTAQKLRRPARFLYSAVEHPAVAATMERVRRLGHDVQTLRIDGEGRVDLEAFSKLMTGDTAMVSVMQVNNETGAVQPVEEIAALARQRNPEVVVHCDGVQGFLRVPFKMKNVDLYALSGHKFHGPKGIGALAMSQRVRPVPLLSGGGQEDGLRSGTLNSPAILGMGCALEKMKDGDTAGRLRKLKERLAGKLQVQGVHFNGPDPFDPVHSAPHILSVRFDGVRGEVMRNALEGYGILVSTGSACSSHKQKVSAGIQALGLNQEQADGTVRISLGAFNTEEEMDEAAACMIKTAEALSRFRRR